jgi:methylmalonyl-CoA mutase cobalamin-binding domain/chain
MVFEPLNYSIINGEAEGTIELVRQLLRQGYSAETILEKGLIAGMNQVAEKFKEQRVMIPEVLMSSRAMNAGLSEIEPHLNIPNRFLGKVVLGTVAGDLHDIGLNLVKMMVMTTGVEVIDCGVDVTPEEFSRAVRQERPEFLLLSALLTTTMPVMKAIIDRLEADGLRKKVKVIVGGAPVDELFARRIGADYYFEDAFEVQAFLRQNLAKLIAHKATGR